MITIHNHFSNQKISAINAKLVSFVFAIVIALFAVQTLSAETRYRVKSSDNLNDIVERFYQGSDLSKGQLMVGVLVKNPNAFRGGNINFLLRGKRLTLPDESDLQQISPDSAGELLSEHAKFFRFGITGDLSPPTLSEMMNNSPDEIDKIKNNDDSDELLSKQKNQERKIDKLQQESDDLKKQLEELVNAKTDRDLRLLELEASLKETLSTNKQASPVVDSDKAKVLEKSNEQLQKKLTETKSKLAVNSSENKALERKVENLKEVLSDNASSGKKAVTRTIESSGSILAKLIWLIPLLLLGLFLYYYFEKKKHNLHVDDYSETIETGKAGYIEPHDTVHAEEAYEEDSLETSVKLDVARAYIEAEDIQSALDILTEIMEEGSDEQRKVAHELLEKISPS